MEPGEIKYELLATVAATLKAGYMSQKTWEEPRDERSEMFFMADLMKEAEELILCAKKYCDDHVI